jgi:hypothetical protein
MCQRSGTLEFVAEVLEVFLAEVLAAQLHQHGVPVEAVENALVLGAARRLKRPAGAAPLRSARWHTSRR